MNQLKKYISSVINAMVQCFKNNKPLIQIKYDGLQLHSGKFRIIYNGEQTSYGYFQTIEVTGNKFLVYGSDQTFSKKGRLNWIFDLDKYDVIFI